MGRPLGSRNKAIEVIDSIPLGDMNETEPQISARIEKTFRVLDRLVGGIVNNNLKGMLVAGAPGCGKTYAIELQLQSLPPNDYHIHSGAMSDVELYKNLYKTRGNGQVFVADDCDSIYYSEDALNLLKRATDPKRSGRVLSWGKNSWVLQASKNDGESIPREFEYFGSAILCTNMDLQKKISAQNNKLARHYAALLDRIPYLDLGIHTKREILVRIWQIMMKTNFCEENDIPRGTMGKQIFEWIRTNIVLIQFPSPRTALKLATMMKTDPETWEETAQVTLFKR